jgi:hypothetical protein
MPDHGRDQVLGYALHLLRVRHAQAERPFLAAFDVHLASQCRPKNDNTEYCGNHNRQPPTHDPISKNHAYRIAVTAGVKSGVTVCLSELLRDLVTEFAPTLHN